jgi:hypothetical protein
MMIKNFAQCEWVEAQLYWATISYARAWWASDGARLHVIQLAGRMDASMLRKIAIEYNVSRLILGAKKIEFEPEEDEEIGNDPAATRLASILDVARTTWPSSLVERANACLTIVDQAKEGGVSKKELISATTKFMWFLEPTDWTLFDRFAKEGLDFTEPNENRDKMIIFYRTLEDRGFVGLSQNIQNDIKSSILPDLPATRILDTLLMARGGRGADKGSLDMLRGFLTTLPEQIEGGLTCLAARLQERYGNDILRSPAGRV